MTEKQYKGIAGNFLICDVQKEYAEHLLSILVKRFGMRFQFHFFSNVKKIEQFAEKAEIEILLIAEDCVSEIRGNVKAKKKFILSESMKKEEKQGETTIFRYQSANEILKIIQSGIGEEEAKAAHKPQKKTEEKYDAVQSDFTAPKRKIGMRQLQEKVEEADKKTKTKDYIVLPEQVNGKKVIWAYGVQTRAYGILVMGIGFAVFVIISSSQKEKEEKKKEFREMKLDYPQIINKFNLYIKSGMTIRKAWFKIAGEYEKDQKEKEQISAKACGRKKAYEEMVNVMYKISGGASEGECYEEYGIRCNLSEYRKFGMMLSQNLRKGTRGLTELLEREAEDAFEQRKNLAKKAGEEAGTKLMIPLFLMLIIVFAIVIVPAFFSIRI